MVALLISLKATHFARKAYELNLRTKADADRLRLFEKKRELLNEVDKQHATLATLSFLTAHAILLFKECPKLHELLPDEFDRLKSNLKTIEHLEQRYESERQAIEALQTDADIASLDDQLATVRRLSIHLDKDIVHERSLLDQLRHLVATAPAA